MSESGDFNPGVWTGHDFDSARRRYDGHVGRSYADATAAKKVNKDLIPKTMETKSRSPLVIVSDVTGSMGEWPATMFSKLPYLELEGKEYLGEDMEISWAAIGDAYSDEYPLQGRPFTSGTDLKVRLEELVIEGNGGGQLHETYELAALYYARNVSMPKAIRPIIIFIGDEMPYDTVNDDHAENYAYNKLKGRLTTKDIFAELKKKFAVYVIIKPYNVGERDDDGENRTVYKAWNNLLDDDHIAILPDPQRVVDVIFGILAKETNRVEYFREEIEGRQKPHQIDVAYKALTTIHTLADGSKKSRRKLTAGESVMHTKSGGKKTKKLIPDDDKEDGDEED